MTKWYYPYWCTFLCEIHNNYYKAWEFEFSCSSRYNRSWFVHECKLYFWDSYCCQWFTKRQYYNRTRERFCFESVIQDCFIEFCMSKDWKFLEENKKDIAKLAKDLDLNYYFKFLNKKENVSND